MSYSVVDRGIHTLDTDQDGRLSAAQLPHRSPPPRPARIREKLPRETEDESEDDNLGIANADKLCIRLSPYSPVAWFEIYSVVDRKINLPSRTSIVPMSTAFC